MLANPSSRPCCSQFLHPKNSKLFLFRNSHPNLTSRKSKFGSFSLLLSTKNAKCFSARALADPPVSNAVVSDVSHSFPQPCSVKIPIGDRHILVETGHIGRQASAAVTVTDGETIVYTSVCLADVPSEPSDFFPLSVHYQERFSAAGRTSGGFFKREGKTKDHEVLICRLIDRPLRPTMMKGFYHETQILSWSRQRENMFKKTIYTVKAKRCAVLSYDGLHSPDSLAVTAAGIAVALSEVPNSKAIAGVRIGLVGDKFIVNPTTKEMENSALDLLLAGTDSAILMIEGYCNFLSEEKLLQAVEVGQDAVRAICNEVEALVKKCGKPKMLDAVKLPPPELYKLVEEIAGDEVGQVLQIKNKIPRRKALSLLEERVLTILTEKGYISTDACLGVIETIPDIVEDEDEDEEVVVDGEVDEGDVHIKPTSRKMTCLLFSEVDVKIVFKEVTSKFLRRRIVEVWMMVFIKSVPTKAMLWVKEEVMDEPQMRYAINSRCGLLPRAHGSALFTRGETQSLAVVTLGDKQMAQRIDNLVGVDDLKRFYLQFMNGAINTIKPCLSYLVALDVLVLLAEEKLVMECLQSDPLNQFCLPQDDFPYTIRVESTITKAMDLEYGICMWGCLALEDAGVPVKCSIAGIAMGMVLDTQEFGEMVAGNEDGVTAFQMDIKVGGITLPIMKKALLQAKDGEAYSCHVSQFHQSDSWFYELHVSSLLDSEMSKSSPPPSRRLSNYAPLIHVMKVNPEKVNLIIGSGGKKVKSIIEETGVEAIDTQDDGIVKITAKDLSSLEKAKTIISNLTMVPTVGDIYRDCEVKSIVPYGVFVEIAPGREGLCHISELSSNWLAKAEDAFKVGDRFDVKLIELIFIEYFVLQSRRALYPDTNSENANVNQHISDSKDTLASQQTPDKGSTKKIPTVAEADVSDETNKQPEKSTGSSKSNSGENILVPQKKFIRRLVSPGKDVSHTSKGKAKKSSSKAVSSISSKGKSSLVNGEANIG
ncbi:hypothetical protein FNV43_RR16736 [Rhamnella rubrinervis]|uniref:polyribonucleotide nucleotidyltransferase n=1 Tax=Rhamnella rubrinervis TaxID=2594499 RepID=A0A8K0GZC4_9ROSA|nr:hypothetical protein FNV43_RR16736 [Rhamnella rubrinervis]